MDHNNNIAEMLHGSIINGETRTALYLMEQVQKDTPNRLALADIKVLSAIDDSKNLVLKHAYMNIISPDHSGAEIITEAIKSAINNDINQMRDDLWQKLIWIEPFVQDKHDKIIKNIARTALLHNGGEKIGSANTGLHGLGSSLSDDSVIELYSEFMDSTDEKILNLASAIINNKINIPQERLDSGLQVELNEVQAQILLKTVQAETLSDHNYQTFEAILDQGIKDPDLAQEALAESFANGHADLAFGLLGQVITDEDFEEIVNNANDDLRNFIEDIKGSDDVEKLRTHFREAKSEGSRLIREFKPAIKDLVTGVSSEASKFVQNVENIFKPK